jgi:hypothetical protein
MWSGQCEPTGEREARFKGLQGWMVYVTAFLDRRAMVKYLIGISWETEVRTCRRISFTSMASGFSDLSSSGRRPTDSPLQPPRYQGVEGARVQPEPVLAHWCLRAV